MNRRKSSARFLLVIFVAIAVFVAGVAAYWSARTRPASDVALQALQSDDRVTVSQADGVITFAPADARSSVGFIFYPGANVDYRAYAPVLRLIAERGYFVALVRVPLNLAFFDTDAAADIIERFPEIEVWVVGGHSLGGVTSAAFAADRPDLISGVVFFASYPKDNGLKTTPIKVLSIYGTNDALATVEIINNSKQLLPADAEFISIEGGNHSQFGSYGFQSGDGVAAISAEEQWTQTADAVARFFEAMTR